LWGETNIGGNFAQVPHKREQTELLLQLGWVEFLNGWVSFHFACGCVRT
jgi:hypothetical protein